MKLIHTGATMTVAPTGRGLLVCAAVALAGALGCVSGANSAARGDLAAAMKQANLAPRTIAPISMPEDGLRKFVATQNVSGIQTAMAAMPGDTLLRMMNWGLAFHRLGRYAESNTAL